MVQAAPRGQATPTTYVLDVSRLIWRLWRGRLPTGIDRVCLAYLAAFADNSLAMVQWQGRRFVLGARASRALFALLAAGAAGLDRSRLVRLLGWAVPAALLRPPKVAGRVYLNVGHTGLDASGLANWVRRHGLRAVHLVHDLIPITHPHFCRGGEAARHAVRMRGALESASGIIVNSADTQVALAQFAREEGLPMPPTVVAHLGIERLPDAATSTQHPRPYFLAIGTIEGRKNHALLLEVWQGLNASMGPQAPDLVLIGQRGWQAAATFAALDAAQHEKRDTGRVIELARCSDTELASWIDGARALLMPSRVEGYGLPVLEALARGTPVIATDLAVYREIAGTIPLLLDPDDAAGWQAAVQAYTHGSPERARQLAALKDFHALSWPEHFAAVEAWLCCL